MSLTLPFMPSTYTCIASASYVLANQTTEFFAHLVLYVNRVRQCLRQS